MKPVPENDPRSTKQIAVPAEISGDSLSGFEQQLRSSRAHLAVAPVDLRTAVLAATVLNSPTTKSASARPRRMRRWIFAGALAACWAVTGLLSLQTDDLLASMRPDGPPHRLQPLLSPQHAPWLLEEDQFASAPVPPPAPRESRRILRRRRMADWPSPSLCMNDLPDDDR